MSNLLSTKEAAEILNCGELKVREYIENGSLKSINHASSGKPKYRISIKAIEQFIEEQESKS